MTLHMESSLHEVWESAAGNPFVPVVGKDSQFTVGLSLLVVGTLLAGFFGLSELQFIFYYTYTLTALKIDPL